MRACIERDDSVGVGTFDARGSIRVCSFSFFPFFLSYLFLLFYSFSFHREHSTLLRIARIRITLFLLLPLLQLLFCFSLPSSYSHYLLQFTHKIMIFLLEPSHSRIKII